MILTLRVKGFRRYVDETIHFAPGVSFIEGENNAGKTTLLYAIEYALFGRVTGHKTLAALMAPKAKQMGVELVMRGLDGHRYRLQRMHVLPPRSRSTTIGHFTLKRSARPMDGGVPAEEGVDPTAETYVVSSDFEDREDALALALQRALGIGRRFFDVAVYLRQGEITSILEGAPRELDIVLGVTSAVVAADEMRAMALEREKEAASLPVIEETLRAMESDRESGRAQAEKLVAERASSDARVTELEGAAAKIADELAALRPLETAVTTLQRAHEGDTRTAQALEDARATLAAVAPVVEPQDRSDQLAALIEREKTIDSTRRERDGERRVLDRKRGDLEARIDRRSDHAHASDGAACESCGQPIDAGRAQREIEAWRAELEAVDQRLSALASAGSTDDAELQKVRAESRAISEERARVDAIAARIAESQRLVERRATAREDAAKALTTAETALRALVPELDARTDLAERAAAHLESARDVLRTKRARASAEHDVAREARGRIDSEQKAIARRLAEIEREHARVRAACDALRERAQTAARLRLLAESFSELQSLLRDRAATALAEQTLQIHRALQGTDGERGGELKELRLDPESYAVLVTPSDVGREVPASAAQGGGHRLLLGLALKLAIGRVVGRPPFLLLDEPTYGLDRARRAALLGRIASLGVTDQILLITHHETDGAHGGRVRVVRKGKTSRIEQETSA